MALLFCPNLATAVVSPNRAVENTVVPVAPFFENKPARLKKLAKRIANRQAEKPTHLLAKAAVLFALASGLALFASILLAFSSGLILFEFGYFALHLATCAIFFAVRAHSDMNNEPDRWAGRSKAKGGLYGGIGVGIGVFLWLLLLLALV